MKQIELINRGMINHYAAAGATLRDCHGQSLTKEEAVEIFMQDSDERRPLTAEIADSNN